MRPPRTGACGDADKHRMKTMANHSPGPSRHALVSPVQRVVTGGLLTVIGINTLAPAWAPAVIPQPNAVARDVVQRLLDDVKRQPDGVKSATQVRIELFGGRTYDARQVMSEVDARLQQIDQRTAAASGTTRAAALEVALVAAGVDRELAAAVAHGSARTEQVERGVAAMERAVRQGTLDPAVLLLGGAGLLDRLSSDVGLEAAFVLGFALAPHLDASARALAETAVSAGQAGISAWHRHHQAVQNLKHPGSTNPVVNAAGLVAGTAVEVLGAGLAFFGPGPVVGLARGGEPVLVLTQFLAAKTAVAGTAKTVAIYTSVPEDAAALVAGFLAGAASHATVDNAKGEAKATLAHVRASGHALKAALDSGDLNAVHAALTDAVATSTPSEKAVWGQVLRTVVEHAAMAG